MPSWIDHPEFGRVWGNGCVAIVDDPSMLDDPIMRMRMADEKNVAVCSPDEWLRHITEEFHKDRLGTPIQEAELEGWDDRAEQLRRLRR